MKNNTDVLFILRVPPPIGGGEIVSEIIYRNLNNYHGFKFLIFSRKSHTKHSQSFSSVTSYFYGFQYILYSLISVLFIRPLKIYIGLPKSWGGFLRNGIIIKTVSLFGVKVYAELHGMGFPFIDNSTYKHRLFLYFINSIQKIRLLSNSISDYLRKAGYRNKISVIDNGVDVPKLPHSKIKLNSTVKILYLGALSEAKGFDRMIGLAERLDEAGISFIIQAVGEWISTEYRTKCQDITYEKNLNNNFIFHGLLIGDKKWEIIQGNDILVVLSNFEGQPIAIIECMALGIPAVAMRAGAIPEMITDGKDGFLINNVEDAFKIIKGLCDNKIYLAEISNNAQVTFQTRFTTDKFLQKIVDFVSE